MPRRRRKEQEEHVDESWLIPYADMLTLLLALFIVLFAMSSIDAEKYQEMRVILNDAFGGGDLFDHSGQVPIDVGQTSTSQQNQGDGQDEYHQLENLQTEIDEYIAVNDLEEHLDTHLDQEGLMVTILDHALFDSGSAEVKAEAKELSEQISDMLISEPARRIRISGHTDSLPISNQQFRSNWDLSAMRALNFMKEMLENPNLSPEYFSVTGYGEHRPVESNDTVEGRAENRRVEILILPNQ
ncbi:flagellar motor protein MotB [Desertibacillus haloalkaliphilus]|uniref:flagellar motor protein MotB n=1 Tax=Desertibacillus haloalkaliphilus TaxID=1328930 RepID=UPI001C261B85|nr:flagellar motor protein MotB [Desertibacillus haloalkaliphilus]MBU8908831.1 flagellar motor protein MotB [Desertibacillus haloalkaliphilus]